MNYHPKFPALIDSAGISIRFITNSSSITVKWLLLNDFTMHHMPDSGIKGIDLYCKSSKRWQYVGTGIPRSFQEISDILQDELGTSFNRSNNDELPTQKRLLTFGIVGRLEKTLWENEREVDIYDAIGFIGSLFKELRIDYEISPANNSIFNQDKSFKIITGKDEFGIFGEISKSVLNNFEIKNQKLILIEIDAEKLFSKFTPKGEIKFAPISKYPVSNRDISFDISNRVTVNLIIETFNMYYGIPPYPLAHEKGVDIVLSKDSYQLNFNNNISLGVFKQLDIKFNFIDYVHVEMINDDENSTDIDNILENRNFHVALAKKTENYKITISGKKIIYGIEYINREFIPDGFYLTPTTSENQFSFFGFQEYKIKSLDIDFLSSFRIGYLIINPGDYNYNFGGSNLIKKDDEGHPVLDNNGNRISLVDDKKFQSLSYSFGFRKKINKFEYNSWFMHTTRPPRVEELFSDGPHLASYAFEIGNPNLDSEKIYGIENSFSYNSKPLSISLVTK